jgi:hypothetical protein
MREPEPRFQIFFVLFICWQFLAFLLQIPSLSLSLSLPVSLSVCMYNNRARFFLLISPSLVLPPLTPLPFSASLSRYQVQHCETWNQRTV